MGARHTFLLLAVVLLAAVVPAHPYQCEEDEDEIDGDDYLPDNVPARKLAAPSAAAPLSDQDRYILNGVKAFMARNNLVLAPASEPDSATAEKTRAPTAVSLDELVSAWVTQQRQQQTPPPVASGPNAARTGAPRGSSLYDWRRTPRSVEGSAIPVLVNLPNVTFGFTAQPNDGATAAPQPSAVTVTPQPSATSSPTPKPSVAVAPSSLPSVMASPRPSPSAAPTSPPETALKPAVSGRVEPRTAQRSPLRGPQAVQADFVELAPVNASRNATTKPDMGVATPTMEIRRTSRPFPTKPRSNSTDTNTPQPTTSIASTVPTPVPSRRETLTPSTKLANATSAPWTPTNMSSTPITSSPKKVPTPAPSQREREGSGSATPSTPSLSSKSPSSDFSAKTLPKVNATDADSDCSGGKTSGGLNCTVATASVVTASAGVGNSSSDTDGSGPATRGSLRTVVRNRSSGAGTAPSEMSPAEVKALETNRTYTERAPVESSTERKSETPALTSATPTPSPSPSQNAERNSTPSNDKQDDNDNDNDDDDSDNDNSDNDNDDDDDDDNGTDTKGDDSKRDIDAKSKSSSESSSDL